MAASGFRRVEIWSRGVDSQVFGPQHRDEALRQSLGLGSDDPLLVYVGRLAPEKNIPALLQAFSRLREAVSPKRRDKLRLAPRGRADGVAG